MSKKILVVDDEPDVLKVLVARLKEHGFDVVEALSADQAMQLIKKDRPDLIVLDIMMPEMTGAEFADQLRQGKDTRHIPFIFLSAIISKEEENELGGLIGKETILAKPYDIDMLVDKIHDKLSGA